MKLLKTLETLGDTCTKLARAHINFTVTAGYEDDGERSRFTILYTDPRQDHKILDVLSAKKVKPYTIRSVPEPGILKPFAHRPVAEIKDKWHGEHIAG
jgi:hypothetical protein